MTPSSDCPKQPPDEPDGNGVNTMTGHPLLDNPGHTLALLFLLLALMWIGTQYAEELWWRRRNFAAAGLMLVLFGVAMVYAPRIVDGRFLWQ